MSSSTEAIKMRASSMLGVLTFFLAIFPGTLLAVFSAGLIVSLLSELPALIDASPARLLIALAISAMGIVGYVALWYAMVRPVTRGIAVGLLLGIVAALSGVALLWGESYFAGWAHAFLFGGPILMACVHIGRLLIAPMKSEPR